MPAINLDAVFAWLGQLILFGGGAAAVAFALFRFLGTKWIENKFAERLEQLRHTQALELQRLRVEIDSLLSGAIKLQEKEFETLPDAWAKLDDAFGHISRLTAPYQEYANVDRMSQAQLEEFLEGTEFTNTQKDEIRHARNKGEKYQELVFLYRLRDVRQAVSTLHNFVERNSIFMPPDLKAHFDKSANALWSAMVSKQVGYEAQDWKMQSEGWDKVKKEVEPLRDTVHEMIYARLQAHGKK